MTVQCAFGPHDFDRGARQQRRYELRVGSNARWFCSHHHRNLYYLGGSRPRQRQCRGCKTWFSPPASYRKQKYHNQACYLEHADLGRKTHPTTAYNVLRQILSGKDEWARTEVSSRTYYKIRAQHLSGALPIEMYYERVDAAGDRYRCACGYEGEASRIKLHVGAKHRPRRARARPPCGTVNGYTYHLNHNEKACAPCNQANNEKGVEARARRAAGPRERRPRVQPIRHGTVSGYQRCRKRVEGACDDCREAVARAARDRRLKKRQESVPLLLADVSAIFEQQRADALFSKEIVAALVAMEDRPWQAWRKGGPISAKGLGELLSLAGVRSVRLYRNDGHRDHEQATGYRLSDGLAEVIEQGIRRESGKRGRNCVRRQAQGPPKTLVVPEAHGKRHWPT